MDASPPIPDPPWTLEIRPEERLLHIDFREIWKYCLGLVSTGTLAHGVIDRT